DVTLGAQMPSGKYFLYLWRSVPQFSTFSKFKGRGNSDGTFVPMDHQPRLVSIMRPGAASNHHISDSDRGSGSPVEKYNNMESGSGEGNTTRDIDFNSNGIKIRDSTGDINASGADHIVAAWAKAPRKFSRAQ
ncbi:hypothetical protein, partial [uncultured Kiloniella sp.]|uniref:DUF7483 domain-containing protein n=1 Tax=uncultured Kiloniella sp. TaxID=1133091 RepID=UPI0026250CCD